MMEDRIEKWLESEFTELALDIKPLSEYIDVMKRLGYKREDFEFNGWQVDFWIIFEKEDCDKIALTGSLWYGDYTLSKEED